jgi:hypothetical protein
VRLRAGRTAGQLTAAARRTRDARRLQRVCAFLGGASVAHGTTYAIDVELTAATYVLLEMTRRPRPLAQFTVSGAPTGASLPRAAGTVRLTDDKVVIVHHKLPTHGSLRVVNAGRSAHFLLAYRLTHARDLGAALQYADAGRLDKLEPLVDGDAIPVAGLLSPGVVAIVHPRLGRGAWVLISFSGNRGAR